MHIQPPKWKREELPWLRVNLMGKAGKMIVRQLLFGEHTKAAPINAVCRQKWAWSSSRIVFSLLIVTLTVMIIACWASMREQRVTLPFCCSFITVMPPFLFLKQNKHTHTHAQKYTRAQIRTYPESSAGLSGKRHPNSLCKNRLTLFINIRCRDS